MEKIIQQKYLENAIANLIIQILQIMEDIMNMIHLMVKEL